MLNDSVYIAHCYDGSSAVWGSGMANCSLVIDSGNVVYWYYVDGG